METPLGNEKQGNKKKQVYRQQLVHASDGKMGSSLTEYICIMGRMMRGVCRDLIACREKKEGMVG